MMLKKITAVYLVDRAAEELKGLILNGVLRCGDRIPTEKDLCAQLGVSRTVVREAKKTLVASGLLEAKGRQGTFVRNDIPDSLVETMSLGLQTEEATIKELIEARRIVEVGSAAMAAEKASASTKDELVHLLDQMETAVKTGSRGDFAQADVSWHAVVAEASENRLILRMAMSIRNLLTEFINLVLETPGSDLVAYEGHKRVTEAILRGDVEGAEVAIREHLNDVEKMILQDFGRQLTSR